MPFAFARDEQVLLDRGRVLAGPCASMLGLREALRRAPGAGLVRLDAARFESALKQLYQGGPEDPLGFELSEPDPARRHRDLLEEAGDAPVIALVNRLLKRAVLAGASDLHIEPHETGLRVRMRVDGALEPVMDRDDVPVKRIVSRLKVMAGLDIAETRLPQDGRIPLALAGRVIDTRISCMPGHYGERVVLRILDRTDGLRPLDALGLSRSQADTLRRIAALPNGIVLATGPTGAGKTTTLYSLLQLADRDQRNIVTVEDPIEYDLPGVSQTQINAAIGMTFAAGLRAVLRQDPDVILLGEIRDPETAGTAAQAALTGHLVFSSLHANSAAGAIVRLRDLGVADFLIAATLRGVVAQRLVRRLCPVCRSPRAPAPAERAVFERRGLTPPDFLHDPGACATCRGTGHAGRLGLFELLEIGEGLRAAIDRGAGETAIEAAAAGAEATLIGQGLQAAARGETSLAETIRVLGDAA